MTTFRNELHGGLPSGEVWMCTLHTVSVGASTILDVASAFESFCNDLWNGNGTDVAGIGSLMSLATTTTEIITTELDPATGKNVAQSSAGFVEAGAISPGASLPPQCCIVLTTRTGVPTRAGRGRMYLPAPDASTLTASGRLNSGDNDVVRDAANLAFANMIEGTVALPVIYHRETRTTTPINGGDVGDVIDTQRRRRDKLVEARSSFVIL